MKRWIVCILLHVMPLVFASCAGTDEMDSGDSTPCTRDALQDLCPEDYEVSLDMYSEDACGAEAGVSVLTLSGSIQGYCMSEDQCNFVCKAPCQDLGQEADIEDGRIVCKSIIGGPDVCNEWPSCPVGAQTVMVSSGSGSCEEGEYHGEDSTSTVGICKGEGACQVACLYPACGEGQNWEITEEGLRCWSDDPCQGVDCSGHGDCIGDNGTAICHCEAGYIAIGVTCIIPNCDDLCENHCGDYAKQFDPNCPPCDVCGEGQTCSDSYTCVSDDCVPTNTTAKVVCLEGDLWYLDDCENRTARKQACDCGCQEEECISSQCSIGDTACVGTDQMKACDSEGCFWKEPVTCDRGCANNECIGQDCTGGLCCNGGVFYNEDHVCNDQYETEYRCANSSCGAEPQVRYNQRKCSGNSAECNGPTQWSNWEPVDVCELDQICVANTTSATCRDCPNGCNNGSCIETECTSGECCNNGFYSPATTVCRSNAGTEYRCENNACAGDAQSRTSTQYCSGSSSSCNGTITWSNWTDLDDCGSNEVCHATAAGAECVNCPYGCESGRCIESQCTSGQCCNDGMFHTSSHICNPNAATEYRCESTSCGGDAQSRTAKQYCSGSSANCDGQTSWGSWADIESCSSSKYCRSTSSNAWCESCSSGYECSGNPASCVPSTPTSAPSTTSPSSIIYQSSYSSSYSVSFSWTSVSGATSYDVNVHHIEGTSPIYSATSSSTSTSITHSTSATLGRQLRWRVRACNNSGCGPYSSYRSYGLFFSTSKTIQCNSSTGSCPNGAYYKPNSTTLDGSQVIDYIRAGCSYPTPVVLIGASAFGNFSRRDTGNCP